LGLHIFERETKQIAELFDNRLSLTAGESEVLLLFGGVVGDTFPVGCAWSNQVVFPEYFSGNPDAKVPEYQTMYGIYQAHCGLENVHMSFGHDGYIAEVMKPYLSDEALYMVRFHSFYAWHRHGAYEHLISEKDRAMLKWVNKLIRTTCIPKDVPNQT
jgi:hypothetical protein